MFLQKKKTALSCFKITVVYLNFVEIRDRVDLKTIKNACLMISLINLAERSAG